MALIEIDGLPSYSMVIFHGYVSQNQMVSWVTMFIYNYDIWVCLTKGESTQNGDFDRENDDEALNIWGNLGG